MTAGGAASARAGPQASPARERSRQRSFYCSATEREEIGRRAEAAGMSVSRFLVACALHGEDGDGPNHPVVLTAAEQRALYKRIARLDRWSRALSERAPGADMSALEALAFLARAARARDGNPEDGP